MLVRCTYLRALLPQHLDIFSPRRKSTLVGMRDTVSTGAIVQPGSDVCLVNKVCEINALHRK
jgi:hypothetical protein